MSEKIHAIVVGASGYVGGELLRLLASHGEFELSAAVSDTLAGTPIGQHFATLTHCYPEQHFVSMEAVLDALGEQPRLAVFSAAPHGASAGVIAAILKAAKRKSIDVHVVDSSADFRYTDADSFKSVYGIDHLAPDLLDQFSCVLPEHALSATTPHIGHPGCFATASLLAAVPLFTANLAEPEIFISGITGSTGSGRHASAGTHHPERHSNLYAYKPLAHRHTPEIVKLIDNASDQQVAVNFVPHSGPYARGIYITLQANLACDIREDDVRQVYRDYYSDSIFTQVVDGMPRLKDVVASNYCHIGIATEGHRVVVMSAIDNLVKGAAGGAMQWMNRLWSLPETSGLKTPAPAWT